MVVVVVPLEKKGFGKHGKCKTAVYPQSMKTQMGNVAIAASRTESRLKGCVRSENSKNSESCENSRLNKQTF